MLIKYKNDYLDIANFYKYHYWYSEDRKWFRFKQKTFSGLLLFFLPFLFFLLNGERFSKPIIINLFIIGSVLFLFGYISSSHTFGVKCERQASKYIKASINVNFSEFRLIFFEDNYFTNSDNLSESKVDYKLILKVIIIEDYIFIYLDSNSAIILPIKQLDEEQIDFLKSKLKKSVQNFSSLI